jgi:hypothetical protein
MFLLRAGFWLSIVILMIPADPKTGSEAPRVTAIQALMAARATIADLSAFCDRNPDVCVTGTAAIDLFSDKAENGVRMLYRYFDENGEDATAVEPGKSTLRRDDLLPAWRGPANKDGSSA